MKNVNHIVYIKTHQLILRYIGDKNMNQYLLNFIKNYIIQKLRISDVLNIPSYSFIGASPDGINSNISNPRFGRMLEIKNIVNREINGIPKLEYWIQMQLQMETCDLNECDFLETKFIEYENEDDFIKDGSFTYSEDNKFERNYYYV